MTWINRLKLWGGILGIVALVFVLSLVFNQRQSRVASLHALVDAPASVVGSSYGGVVTAKFVEEGDVVKKGDKLFTLNSLGLQQDVANGIRPGNTEAYDVNAKAGTITYKSISDGYVASIEAQEGTYLGSGQEMAVVVADGNRSVVAEFELNPSEYGRVEKGAGVQIVLPNNQILDGKVAGIQVKVRDDGEGGEDTLTQVRVTSEGLLDPSLVNLTRLDTPVLAIMQLRDDGWLAGPTEAMLAFLTKIGLRG